MEAARGRAGFVRLVETHVPTGIEWEVGEEFLKVHEDTSKKLCKGDWKRSQGDVGAAKAAYGVERKSNIMR